MGELHDEELDRELVERSPKSLFFGEVVKIKVGKKVLSFESDRGDRISFDRRTDGMKITLEKVVVEHKHCNLGHYHETGRTTTEYAFFGIDFEMIEQLKEWAEQGVWVSPNRGKPRKRK